MITLPQYQINYIARLNAPILVNQMRERFGLTVDLETAERIALRVVRGLGQSDPATINERLDQVASKMKSQPTP